MIKEHGAALQDGMTMTGHVGYGQSYGACAGERCDRKEVKIHARFVARPEGDEAQLTVGIRYIYGRRRVVQQLACMTLVPADAKTLALAIAPPDLSRAWTAHPQLVMALMGARDILQQLQDQGQPVQIELRDALRALDAAGIANTQRTATTPSVDAAAVQENLPDGLSRNEKGALMYRCESCDASTEWHGNASDFQFGDPTNVCGGSPSCCP